MKWSFIFLLLTSSINALSQRNFRPQPEVAAKLAIRKKEREGLIPKNYIFNKMEQVEIYRCNTAKNSFYHTSKEKEFILLMNLARVDKETLYSYIVHRYDSMFINQLPDIRPDKKRLILKSSYGLHLSAKVHAKKSGRTGSIGHQNLDRRVKMFNFYLKPHPIYSENCSYTETDHPLVHFLQLMNSNGHFVNIMSTSYNSVGVSIEKHMKYGMNGVTCFSFK